MRARFDFGSAAMVCGFGPKRRYMKGMKPRKFFNVELLPELRELFHILGLGKHDRGWRFFKAFMEIDTDCGGTAAIRGVSEFIPQQRRA